MTPREIWQELLSGLGPVVEAQERSLWLEPLRPTACQGGHLELQCPNNLHRNTVAERFSGELKARLAKIMPGLGLRLVVPDPAERRPGPRQMELPRLAEQGPRLNRRFVFENFLAGGGNEFAFAAAKAMVNGGGLYSGSLFLVSSTGLGKSHLTQAVGHHMLHHRPGARVAYLTAEEFTNQMIAAIRGKRAQEFKDRFRLGCDCLLLEDVHFLAGKEKTQDELIYTLDALADAGKRVVFTGREAPAQIKGLSPALSSRLADSITVGIEPPDFATRLRIVQRQANEEGLTAPQAVLEFLAQEIPHDVRRLRSAMVGLMARASLTGRPPSLALAAEVLGQISARLKRISAEEIKAMVAAAYGLEAKALTSKSRKKAIVGPRNVAMWLCRRHTEASFSAIGQAFNRDHATVMHGVDQVERRKGNEPKLTAELSYLEQRLGVNANG